MLLAHWQDSHLIKPSGRSFDQGGTTRQSIFDPLDADECSRLQAKGLRVYATVLQVMMNSAFARPDSARTPHPAPGWTPLTSVGRRTYLLTHLTYCGWIGSLDLARSLVRQLSRPTVGGTMRCRSRRPSL